MLSGKDRGKTGKVLSVYSKRDKVVVEGLNLMKKNRRPKKQGEKGEVVSIPRAIQSSNVSIVCPGCKKITRIGYQISGDKKVRICKKCQTQI